MDGLHKQIIATAGFKTLNPMQLQVMDCKDNAIVLLSPTGSGKTLAFLLWIAKRLKEPGKNLQALIIVPSRELAQQIYTVFKKHLPSYKTATFYGGRPLKNESGRLASDCPDVLIATPGRLLDHIQRRSIDLSHISTLVIDEMDKCLDLGFLPDIKRILRSVPHSRNILLSSATMPSDKELLKFAGSNKVLDFTGEGVAPRPAYEVVRIPSPQKDKLQSLITLLDSVPTGDKTIVFANHRESAERIYTNLKKEGFPVVLYHGGLEQQDRELALISLKNGSKPILVSTDLGARGLDIPEVDNIIHYHIPTSGDAFIHRNGRTARAGNTGTAYVIVNEDDSLPDYINFDRTWIPGHIRHAKERGSGIDTLIFNIGKKDKVSRGDVLGYLTKQIGMPATEIGKIEVGEYYSAVAVPSSKVKEILSASEGTRLKNKRFRQYVLD